MKYLISGHPRTRTAWLCALLNAHHSLCYHDVIGNEMNLGIDAGIADPGLACIHPVEALKYSEDKPRVCLIRQDWAHAFGEATNVWLTPELVDEWEANCLRYAAGAGLVLEYSMLEEANAVKAVIETCTKQPASDELIAIFQQLEIQQRVNGQYDWLISESASTPA